MSSGHFPLSTYTKEGQELTLVSAQLRAIIERAREAANELDVPEDARSDGEYIGRLRLALDMIVEAIDVREPENCEKCHKRLIATSADSDSCVCIPF